MLFFYLVLVCLCQSLLAVDLLIYDSFTEIRQSQHGQGVLTYSFKDDEYSNIIDGSISWDGTSFVRQELSSTSDSLKGAEVVVKQSSVCECETINAKIVDPVSMLLENVDTGAYFYADAHSIEYTSKRPGDSGYKLKIQFSNNNEMYNGNLSYLMRGITWAPNYDLFLTTNNNFTFRAYANIKNTQQRQYSVDNTYLLGGNIQLASTSSPSLVSQPVPLIRPAAAMSYASSNTIQSDGEQQGIYSYLFSDNYILQPSSSIRLPFVDITVKYHFYYQASTSIGSGQFQGVFQRTYDLTPNRFMPAGVLTIRQDGTLVGQANLPDIPDNYTQTVSVGQDNDIRYAVNGNMTSSTSNNGIVTMQTYYLKINITNFKDKTVKAKLNFYGAIQTILNYSSCSSATINGNMLILSVNLAKGENKQCMLEVTLKYA